MPDLFIPPPGFYFRLFNHESGKVLYSRNGPDPEMWHWFMSTDSDDQLFELIHGTGNRAGQYAIKGKVSGKVLFSRRSPDPCIGHITGDGYYDDNWFTFELGTGNFSSLFRINCPISSTVWVSRNTAQPGVCNYPTGGVHYPDQYFMFVFEDTEIDHVEYHIDQGKILNSTPMVIATQTLENKTDVSQTLEASVNTSVTETSTFQFALGFSVKVGTSFEAGVPGIADGKIGVDVTSTSAFTWGSSTAKTKTYTARFPVNAPAHTTVTAKSSVTQSEMNVPITVYSKSKATGVVVKTEGTYYGVSTWNLRHTVANQ
ncbi:hypothetical protein JR316_0011921 [Psilocybe cubensis]|uniref:Agglutinin domain-containing protein n=2 Tax=Psilocybe cubensis TaxID=181762 RepID=A0A8H7XNN5_PSICU|nr:hypothetical protein JR316_0011921 [Psilocybe cubensis]KAH9476346.1 hypothetical protein JR316_0011921 [Psilocybe cubensis]